MAAVCKLLADTAGSAGKCLLAGGSSLPSMAVGTWTPPSFPGVPPCREETICVQCVLPESVTDRPSASHTSSESLSFCIKCVSCAVQRLSLLG